ncbi:MAG: hypothetical protein JW741_02630 [Sedimentisphaerales bacterium]|nr:hypothetical protein [Sedimentisphaerales bacterium]
MKSLSGLSEVFDFRDTTPQRESAERILARAHLLTNRDRALLALHVDAGNSFHQIARLLGVRPTTVARRIRKITERLADPTYPLCARSPERFAKLELSIIRDFFVRGLSMAEISRGHGVSYYRARATVQKAEAFAGSMRSLARQRRKSGSDTMHRVRRSHWTDAPKRRKDG